jgi:hypothetical protein
LHPAFVVVKFFDVKDFLKRNDVQQFFLGKAWSFDCEKQFPNSICEKHVAKMFSFAFVSKGSFSF